jgi:exopolyphosphatase/guanosine-5'-triphosphate,3'-diphosphate pyrophosphatase
LLALRLAVLLCHARRDPDLEGLRLAQPAGGRLFTITCRPGWSALYPQSAHLLREEVLAWQKTSNWRVELTGA